MHQPWCLPNRDPLLRTHILLVQLDDHLFNPSECILITLVVVVDSDTRDLLDFTQVHSDGVLLPLVEGDQPHVMVIVCVVETVEEFIQSAVV